MSKYFRRAIACTVVTLLSPELIGCFGRDDSENRRFESRPEVSAPREISDSFSVLRNPSPGSQPPSRDDADQTDLGINHAVISLSKSALEKEFLFQSVTTRQSTAAMGNGNRSRIVAFRHRGNKLFLMEAVQGHSVTRDIPQNLVLAEFPILNEDGNWIAFDFNAGMSQLFTAPDWYAHDLEGPEFNPNSHFTSVKSRFSFIEEASLDASNRLMIRQVAQTTRPIFGMEEINEPIEIKYYLSAYRPDPSFRPVTAKDMDRIGFFETAPELTLDGTHLIHATHFNQENPIVYAISANTPSEYRQAVKEGVLYWNKAFGKEVVQVIDAPAEVTAPNPNYNVIQWINWDSASFAYADAQMDPRTGETLHAQVYLTSAFAFGGQLQARNLLHRLLQVKGKTARPSKLSLTGFEQESLCQMDLTDSMTSGLINVLTNLLADLPVEETGQEPDQDELEAKLLKASQDHVRLVTAHETGHTLGLRHNFAGSIAANYRMADRDKLMRAYFDKQAAPEGVVATSSVMDYLPFEETLLTGDRLLSQKEALDYDRKAIETLYLGKTYSDAELPLFCTDSDVEMGTFADCHPFDAGSSFVEYAMWDTEDLLKNFPALLMEGYIEQKAPIKGKEPKAVEKVSFPAASKVAKSMMRNRSKLFKSFTTSGKLLKVRRTFPIVTAYNEESVRKAELDYLGGEVERLGGVEAVFSGVPDDFAVKSFTRFSALLEGRRSGTGYARQAYEFSDPEIIYMKNAVEKYLKQLQEALIKEDLVILNGKSTGDGEPGKLLDHRTVDALIELFKGRIQKYVYSPSAEYQLAEVDLPALEEAPAQHLTLRLPTFSYPFEIRKSAASLFSESRGEALEWALHERQEVQDEFNKFMDDTLSVSLSELKPGDLSKAAARWVLENSNVSAAF